MGWGAGREGSGDGGAGAGVERGTWGLSGAWDGGGGGAQGWAEPQAGGAVAIPPPLARCLELPWPEELAVAAAGGAGSAAFTGLCVRLAAELRALCALEEDISPPRGECWALAPCSATAAPGGPGHVS